MELVQKPSKLSWIDSRDVILFEIDSEAYQENYCYYFAAEVAPITREPERFEYLSKNYFHPCIGVLFSLHAEVETMEILISCYLHLEKFPVPVVSDAFKPGSTIYFTT
jgi:hypothetical protein